MKKGQGSLEYLLILAAILAIAVVVVVVANSMLSAPEEQTKLQQDRYACSLQGIELTSYTSLGVVPSGTVKFGGNICSANTTGIVGIEATCTISTTDGTTTKKLIVGNSTTTGCLYNVTSI